MEALRPWDAFALRPLTDDDLPLLRHWLEKPHVRTWFEHPDHWLREARQRRTEFAWIRHFIALCGQTPVGFCQYYPYVRGGENWHGSVPVDGSYSIDYLVGDETSLRRGLGARMVLALIRILRDVPDARRVIVRPDPANVASRQTLLAAGFAYDADNQLFILCPLHAVHDAPHRATPALQGKTSMSYTKEDVYRYHSQPRPGKLEVLPTKSGETQDDLTLAYSPGVADACRAIQADPAEAARLTGRSNLVAVISNGTAVLGLGDIGPLAGKPVMEGKGMLFKLFADVDVYDLELDCKDPDTLIQVVKALEPTFGGINLEDIKAPECFEIEAKLKAAMNIPVFHDDQHGTAVISGAGLLNAARIAGRRPEDMKTVIVGAGAAGIACARFYVSLGVARDNIWMFDSKGLIHQGRTDLHPTKAEFAQPAARAGHSLADAMTGAHLFLGLSKPGVITADMVRSMAPHPVIFACANPVPEITYAEAKAARPDVIMGTGRSDNPNQINNVSGFPFIFRGALDVRATEINEAMKVAAARALADLAREPVPAEVSAAYGGQSFPFGPAYIIPKPLDPRIIEWATPAVAQAAMKSGAARAPIADLNAYRDSLRARVAAAQKRAEALRAAWS